MARTCCRANPSCLQEQIKQADPKIRPMVKVAEGNQALLR